MGCWLPPIEHRSVERSYVKFSTTSAAEAAHQASDSHLLYNQGLLVKVTWRLQANKTQDTRDFDASGCNMGTSRDIFREQARQRMDGGGSRSMMLQQKNKDEKKKRSRSKSKKDEKKKKRSKSEKRKRSKSKSRKRKKSTSSSSSSSSSSS